MVVVPRVTPFDHTHIEAVRKAERAESERRLRTADAQIRLAAMVGHRLRRWTAIYRERERIAGQKKTGA